MNKKLYTQILDALKDRTDWETRQEGFYRMRFRGLKRRNKPYPGAPDMHYALADSLIEKLKPFYVQQIYANEALANFVCTKEQDQGMTVSAANWFDYQIKQQSNFERTLYVGIDKMLEGGFVPVKTYWHAHSKQVCFDACDPLHVIVPKWTERLCDADWLVHVMHVSEAQYRANPLYNQDDDFVKSIKGKGNAQESGDNNKEQTVTMREGLTYGQNDDQIVLWEVYRKDATDDKAAWVIDTVAPVRGWNEDETEVVRATFGLPFKHGQLPFVMVRAEVTDKGYYSPRGIAETVAPMEIGLCKTWNAKLQHLDYHGSPTYQNTSGNPIPNANNFRAVPGAILPSGLQPTVNPGAPVDFDQEMQFTRALAEDRVSVPDFGTSEHLSGRRGSKGQVTATQVNAVVGQSGQSNDLRARIFRLDLADIYKQAWALLIQYKAAEWKYVQSGEVKQLPPTALHMDYIISPNGSADSWNKAANTQKALAMYQLLFPNQYIKKGELTKWLLEHDDPRSIKRLFEEPNDEQEAQAEQQAQEISIMLLGWPAKVNEADNDKAHVLTLAQFVQRRLGQNEPVTPEFARLALAHGSEHIEGLRRKQDPALRQIEQQLMPVVQVLGEIANAQDRPQNVLPMQPQGGSVPTPPQAGGPPAAAPSQPDPNDTAKVAIQAGNMLVAMAKAGMPVTHAEINKVLEGLSLPPLAMQPVTSLPVSGI